MVREKNRHQRSWTLGALCATGFALSASGAPALAQDVNMDQLLRLLQGETLNERGVNEVDPITTEFFLDQCRLRPFGGNTFWSLQPCYQLYLAGDDEGAFVEVYITVLREIFVVRLEIDGRVRPVRTRIIEEREYEDGELVEISRNYFARCWETGDIFYFGEAVCDFEDDECVSHEGAWLAGVNGAEPGIIMPGRFLLGSLYFQEHAPGVAEDFGENVEMGVTVEVPAGVFEDCVVVLEGSGLDPEEESVKIYAPGVGLIFDDELELVSYGRVPGCRGTPILDGDGFVPEPDDED